MQLPLDYVADDHLLRDKVILITGAGGGIGAAVARCFAAHGASLVLLGRTVSKLEAVYDQIENAGGPKPAIFPMDLLHATPDDAARLAQGIHDTFGHLDGVLHNASVLGMMASLAHYEPQTWLEVMQINVNASFLLTTTLLPLLERREDARVVFTSSGVGRHGRAHWGAYSVSKFATEGMMQILADETQSQGRIKVMSINPGATRTKMRAAAFPGEDPETLKTPEQITPAYLYLFGPYGADLHGLSLQV
jgi:NAD(P)-dependent dehydrogenase (short-subunit alcohol dehydrogenase family)